MRKRRRLARMLVVIGVGLWIPELYLAWVLIRTLTMPVRGPNGHLAQIHVHLNGTAWAVTIGWALLCWALIGWGVRLLVKRADS